MVSFKIHLLNNPPSGVDTFLLFSTSGVTLAFRSFQGKQFVLSLPNFVWVFIGLIACTGFGMEDYWISSLLGIDFGDKTFIANSVIAFGR